MNLFVSCGEVSGDLYAADFITEVLARAPELQGNVWGMMGPRAGAACRDPGGRPRWSYEELKLMGILEVIPALPRVLRLRRAMVQAIMERRPGAAVLIDSPDYHLPLAAALRRAGYAGRIVSLIPPTVWAWRSGRVKNLRRDFDLCLPLFSFEHKFLLERGARSLWSAHPLVWNLRGCVVPEALQRRLEGARPIALIPGSRRYDIRFHLDILLGAADLLRGEGYLPVFSVAPGLSPDLAEELRARVPERGFETWEGEGRELMAACLAVAGVSGTVAVEAMLLRRFMVVIYNMNPVTKAILSRLVRIPHISIPNLLLETGKRADTSVYPELLCRDATPEGIVRELRRYLDAPALREETDRRLEAARGFMGTGNAAAFWAERVLELMGGQPPGA